MSELYGEDKFKIYTQKLLNYHFTLDYKIKPPFEKNIIRKKEIKKIIEYTTLNLISIFEDQVLVEIEYYKDGYLILKKKKWLKKGSIIKNYKIGNKVRDCIIKSIYVDKILLKCGKEIKIKTLEIPLNIKEKEW